MNLGDRWIMAKGTRRAFGILYFARYVDDLFIVADKGSLSMSVFYR